VATTWKSSGSALLALLTREWLFFIAALGLIATTAAVGHLPKVAEGEFTPILLLWGLFVTLKGIENSRALCHAGCRLERLPAPGASLVFLAFLLGMFLTIDVALVTLVPLFFTMRLSRRNLLILLASFAAHVGAALFPFGTPQNLFIYFHYQPGLFPFMQAIAPFVLGMVILLIVTGAFSGIRRLSPDSRHPRQPLQPIHTFLYLVFFLLLVLAVTGVLPWGIVLLPLLYAWLFDIESLRIDYFLLLTFVLFLGLAANLRELIAPWVHQPHHLFLLASGMSQFVSNVPTTLLLQPITPHWQALLWGTNVGGFGTPIAALANLILLRLYHQYHGAIDRPFWLLFVAGNLLMLGAGIGLYFLLHLIG